MTLINVGTRDYLCAVDISDLQLAVCHGREKPSPVSIEFLNAVDIIMDEEGLSMPSNIEDALKIYITLKHVFENY